MFPYQNSHFKAATSRCSWHQMTMSKLCVSKLTITKQYQNGCALHWHRTCHQRNVFQNVSALYNKMKSCMSSYWCFHFQLEAGLDNHKELDDKEALLSIPGYQCLLQKGIRHKLTNLILLWTMEIVKHPYWFYNHDFTRCSHYKYLLVLSTKNQPTILCPHQGSLGWFVYSVCLSKLLSKYSLPPLCSIRSLKESWHLQMLPQDAASSDNLEDLMLETFLDLYLQAQKVYGLSRVLH